MPRLQQLELNVTSGGSSNLLDGQQWEKFIIEHLPLLSICNFKFKILNIDHHKYDAHDILVHFRSNFWLDTNRPWYVAFDSINLILYTIPYFASQIIKYPHNDRDVFHPSTLPNEKQTVLYDRIDEIELGPDCKLLSRYRYVKKLTLYISNLDTTTFDVSRVEYLCIKTATWSLKKLFDVIKRSMTNLHHLNIDCNLSWTKMTNTDHLQQICVLNLSQFNTSPGNDQIELGYLFPYVERLTITIDDCQQMIRFIDQMKCLSYGSFRVINMEPSLVDSLRQWIIDRSSRLKINENFTLKINPDQQCWIHIWMVGDYKPLTEVDMQAKEKPLLRFICSRYCCLL
ncbi:unnamed protein product [Adineta ricciae]|uniref:Uncharacterized protein n=1 Tax=Adineta ricciae TaxID=249248 RepID=A0A814G4G4_ADIRI|nr:unnamed protein product [Adineta ricciae]CAF1529038.1 unnamed protein product [Adineta ricciae]